MTPSPTRPRLEAPGLWRESTEAEPRAVTVRLGVSTLMLSGEAGEPLAHWALAGTHAIGAEAGATRYAILADGGETLEIRDAAMTRAIAESARPFPVSCPAPPPGPARLSLSGLLLLGLAALAALKGPDFARAQAARMMPPAQAREFGDRMLLAILETHGPLCAAPDGARALGDFGARIAPGARLRVLDLGGGAMAAALPGPVVLIDRAALARASGPEELAGWIAQALGPEPGESQTRRLMETVGVLPALGYVLHGELSEAALARAARAALEPPAESESHPPAPGAAGLPAGEWAAVKGVCG